MLHLAREEGHTGRLVGVDPDEAMLARARRRDDIEWVLGTAAAMDYDGEFDLAVMASNAFHASSPRRTCAPRWPRSAGRWPAAAPSSSAPATCRPGPGSRWNPANGGDLALPDGRGSAAGTRSSGSTAPW